MAREISITAVKPSDFDVRDHLWDSPFQDCEQEIVARNIILISKWNNDTWSNFSWKQYRVRCRHKTTDSERSILDGFVRKGILKCENEIYSIQNEFIVTLKQFIKQ